MQKSMNCKSSIIRQNLNLLKLALGAGEMKAKDCVKLTYLRTCTQQ